MKSFIVLLFLCTPLALMSQDIIYLASESAKPILKQWEHHTYNGIHDKKMFETQQEQSSTILFVGLNNLYNTDQYSLLSPVSINPLEALQHQVWKSKSGKVIYDPSKEELAPSWLVKSYLDKKINPNRGKHAREFKSTYCVLPAEGGAKKVEVVQVGLKTKTLNPVSNFKMLYWPYTFNNRYVYYDGYSYNYGQPHMRQWRNGILICQ